MTSAAPSPSPAGSRGSRGEREHASVGHGEPNVLSRLLSGPVAVCVDRPVLSLDRPFTYELPAELEAGVGSLVQVPFHGRLVRGWVLGATDDVPARMLAVKKLVSPVRFFDERSLEVLRWVSERYVAPLASVIERSVPPRVASEEVAVVGGEVAAVGGESLRGGRFAPSARSARLRASAPSTRPLLEAPAPSMRPLLGSYRNGSLLLEALRAGRGEFVVRTAAMDEQAIAVEAVGEALAGGRGAIVLVPEVEPLPATAAAVLDAFADDAVLFAGGSKRARYRMWLDIAGGRYPVVVGTRPAVFAPLDRVGLVYVSRESHAGHREERSPYYHVRDVALARAGFAGGVCVMAGVCPSAEATATEAVEVAPRARWWPPVEVVRPGPEGRAPRLVATLKTASRAFVYSPLPGYGVARVCRACREPAACAACGGVLRAEGGSVRCAVCGAEGRCAACGSARFGIAPGGAERVEEWASRVTAVPVRRASGAEPVGPVGAREVLVGGVDAVKDLGPEALGLDLVAILDADLAGRRPGLAARERALVTWMEAAAWAAPDGRVVVQTRSPNDPAVQALVTGNPARFHRAEVPRRAQAGFPVGAAVFRVAGTAELARAIEGLAHLAMLVTAVGGETLCLLALDAADVATFGRAMRDLAGRGVVARVEAEPHL